MKRAKVSNKKGQTKVADANDLNSIQEQSLGDEFRSDVSTFKNGTVKDDELKEKEVQAPKRSGRVKKEEKVVTEEKAPKKMPATKERGKNKASASEVLGNEIDSKTDNTEAANDKETLTTSKGRVKKATQKATSTEKLDAKTLTLKDVSVSENKPKITGGRKNKQENIVENKNGSNPTTSKKISRNLKIILENLETTLVENPKKRGKAFKNKEVSVEKVFESLESEESEEEQRPAKKKDRSSKKDVAAEQVVVSLEYEESLEDKIKILEKKRTKRGRAASKDATKAEVIEEIAANEVVLPKKRSHKALSLEKEIVEEIPNKGRGKKKAEKPNEGINADGPVNA